MKRTGTFIASILNRLKGRVVRPGTSGLSRGLLLVCAVTLPLVAGGCVAYIHTRVPIVVGAGPHYYHGRPHRNYVCYDCHGYTYFDPYYDFCVQYGFRVNWDRSTSLYKYYWRNRAAIRTKPGWSSKYKYRADYRFAPKYKTPTDYETWKKTDGRTFYSGKEKSSDSDKDKSSSKTKKTSKKDKK